MEVEGREQWKEAHTTGSTLMLILLQLVAGSIKTTRDAIGDAVVAWNVALHLLFVGLFAGFGGLLRRVCQQSVQSYIVRNALTNSAIEGGRGGTVDDADGEMGIRWRILTLPWMDSET